MNQEHKNVIRLFIAFLVIVFSCSMLQSAFAHGDGGSDKKKTKKRLVISPEDFYKKIRGKKARDARKALYKLLTAKEEKQIKSLLGRLAQQEGILKKVNKTIKDNEDMGYGYDFGYYSSEEARADTANAEIGKIVDQIQQVVNQVNQRLSGK